MNCRWQNDHSENGHGQCDFCKKPRERCEATPEMEMFRLFGYKAPGSTEGVTFDDLIAGMIVCVKRAMQR